VKIPFVIRHHITILFLSIALCCAGAYALIGMPSSIFPQTNFPRVVILIDNGVMPASEMMATVTRPVEESLKDIPGVVTVRSKTGRGSAEINVFFTWKTSMTQAELYVQGKLAVIQKSLPANANSAVWRLTFAAFPVMGLSMTGSEHSLSELWEIARYELEPKLLRIPSVARIGLVGGRSPEYHVIVDPLRMRALNLTLQQVSDVLSKNNLITPTGMLEENYQLYLTVVDGRLQSIADIENLTVSVAKHQNFINYPIRIRDFARVLRSEEPAFNIVTANGVNAVLLNVYSQPDGSTTDIVNNLKKELETQRKSLPPDIKLSIFYDQSLLISDSIQSVWEAILLGLLLSMTIIYVFLKNWRATFIAAIVIPATVFITILLLRVLDLSFNLMTLGGIAAAIGLIIDDAIVVIEAIYTKCHQGYSRIEAITESSKTIFKPLITSTLTPVVVFLPLAFLDGITGVFFRALALTMVTALLTSLVLAMTLIPVLTTHWGENTPSMFNNKIKELPYLIKMYEIALRTALQNTGTVLLGCAVIVTSSVLLYGQLESEFLPFMDEGGFVLDYHAPWGTSLTETDRQLKQAELLLKDLPELESYSRRTGARLALGISQAHSGDFLIKLKSTRTRSTEEVIHELRQKLHRHVPGIEWEFAGILSDLIGDLTWSPRPIEVKLFSTNSQWLKQKAPEVKAQLDTITGVVDSFDGLETTGSTINLHVRETDALRLGFTTQEIAFTVNAAMLGQKSTYILEDDRVVAIRVKMETDSTNQIETLKELPLRSIDGRTVKLSQVADIVIESGQLELHREDLRQLVAVSARLEGRDLGSAIAEIADKLNHDTTLPAQTVEIGGLYEQQQEAFYNLMRVLLASILLVFIVLLIEFRSLYEPIAILFGSALAMSGTVFAWYLTGTSVNIISLLGAIIGIGVVAKNGILMLDAVQSSLLEGNNLKNALIISGQKRLRPVVMTSLATVLGLFPLAYGIGAGSDMLKPLAIAVIGALSLSVLLSLVATPTLYFLMKK
jgi:CzcA family heavy metal efflux pump